MTRDEAYRALKAEERRLEKAHRERGEMIRAKREAVAFMRGPDGVWRLPERPDPGGIKSSA